jgi:hypothetical protein
VNRGENPADWFMFHTHPSGMSAGMSSTDVKQLAEMATDLPGVIARSMILPQGKMIPVVHEAVCVEGKVFMREGNTVAVLDDTGAKEDLKSIGWFDKPIPPPVQYKSRAIVPMAQRGYLNRWFDETPTASEITKEQENKYDAWASEKRLKEEEELCESWLGESVMHAGGVRMVIDAYVWDNSVQLTLDDGTEADEMDVTFVETRTVI